MAQITSGQHRGWRWDEANNRLDVVINGTEIGFFDDTGSDLTLNTNGLTVTAGGITITAGGFTVSNGGIDITGTTALGGVTYTWPGADGSNGQQLTTNGSGTLSWAAAASLREYKHLLGERNDADASLDMLVGTPVYDFRYKEGKGTGDTERIYTGVMADEAPWAMHFGKKILDPISTFGHTLLAFRALNRRLRALEAAV